MGIYSLYNVPLDPTSDHVASIDGTSMATPLAASVAALIRSKNPTWTAAQVKQQLFASAEDISGLPCNAAYGGKMGAGRINAFQAVNTAAPRPVAAFVPDVSTGCGTTTVAFTDQSTGSITSRSWDFGDGATSTAQNPTHTYAAPGIFAVKLTVTGADGSASITRHNCVTISSIPAPSVSANVTTGAAPLTVQFTGSSSGNATSWLWNFGDGTGASSVKDPVHVYAVAGTYTVTLTATNACGSQMVTRTAYVTVSAGATQTTSLALRDIKTYGTLASGTYARTVRSDNSREKINEALYQTTVDGTLRYLTLLEHKWTFEVKPGATTVFAVEGYRTNTTGTSPSNIVFSYSRDDRTYRALITLSNTTEQKYSVAIPDTLAGTIFVRATDSDRTMWPSSSGHALASLFIDSMSITSTGSIAPRPAADFTSDKSRGPLPLTVAFRDLSAGHVTSWLWDFGDGTTSTSQNPVHTHTTPGSLRVALTARGSGGSHTKVVTSFVDVTNRAPDLDAIGSKSVDEGALLNFTVHASDPNGTTPTLSTSSLPGGASFDASSGTFSWTPTFTQAGIYSVTFRASDGFLVDSEIVAITVRNVNRAPSIAAIGAKTVDEGAIVAFGLTATDADGDPIAFSGVALPSTAVLIDNGGGRATFRWCPGFDQQGIHNVKFVADDGTRADTVQVTITVRGLFKGDIHAGGDGVVDAQDLAAFADAWGSTETDPNWNSRCNLDQTPVDGKQVIDERDRLELEKCFGKRQ